MNRKKILFIYPHNPFDRTMGANARMYELVEWLKSGYEVHLFAENNFCTDWNSFLTGPDTVGLLLLNEFGGRKAAIKNTVKNTVLWKTLKKWIKGNSIPKSNTVAKIEPKTKLCAFPNFAFQSSFKLLDTLTNEHQYDTVLVGYIFWAKLVTHPKLANSKKILLLEDFQTAQLLEKHASIYSLGDLFEEEIEMIRLFDDAICISNQEKWLFSQFCKSTRFHFAPHFLEPTNLEKNHKQTYDILFIGSDNPFNIEAIKWFMDYVWKKIGDRITLQIIGKVSAHVDNTDRVDKIMYMKDLAPAYADCKIVICPMQAGTGMKIKVVEALSYGKPVVCTFRALDGFPDYNENGCLLSENAEEFADNIIKLLYNDEFLKQKSEEAKKYFLKNFSKEVVSKKLAQIF